MIAMSDPDPIAEGVQALLGFLRDSGDGLETASPDFDIEASAARLRRTARIQGLVRGEFAPENELSIQGDKIEEDTPPFDVDAGAAGLGGIAREQGLLGDPTADVPEPRRDSLLADFPSTSTAAITSGVAVLHDRYRLRSPLGAGGFSRAWLADDLLLQRQVVLKVLPLRAGTTEPEHVRRRVLKEATALARVQHPSISQIHDVFVTDEQPWISMEYIEGQTLDQVVQDQTLDDHRIAEIGAQILGGLRALHTAGVLHRDIKPANIIVARGAVHLVDFGIAQVQDDLALTRRSYEVEGTIEFVPPERLLGQSASSASDLWSLGATLFYAMEGHSPFRRGERVATIYAILNEQPPSPHRKGKLSEIVLQLLHKDPVTRPGAATVATLLEEVRDHDMMSAKATQPPQRTPPQLDSTLGAALNSADANSAAAILLGMPIEEVIQILASRTPRNSGAVLQAIAGLDPATLAPILVALPARVAGRIFSYLEPPTAAVALAAMPLADAARILRQADRQASGLAITELSTAVAAQLLGAMPASEAAALLTYVQPSIAASVEGRGAGAHGLTPCELEVVRLVGEGYTNQQIAESLFVSIRTVETHLSHIFAKLRVTSRTGILKAFSERP